MSVSVSLNTEATMGVVNVVMARKTMDLARDLSAQLLQSLPPAPQPEHLGQNVNLLV